MHWTACLPLPPTLYCKRRRLEQDLDTTVDASSPLVLDVCNTDIEMENGEMEVLESCEQAKTDNSKTEKPVQFSKQLISFTLFGTREELGSHWAENVLMLSSRVAEVNKHFPDIPKIFNFGLSTVQFGAVGVFCSHLLQKGALLGPFTGRKLSLEDAHKKYKGTYWEIHRNGGVKYCLDGSDPAYRNWMYFIQYARSKKEQNLIAVQYNENLYFKAERDVQQGDELLVWYDQVQYDLYMGIPQGFQDVSTTELPRVSIKEVDEEEVEEGEEGLLNGSESGEGEGEEILDTEEDDIEIEIEIEKEESEEDKDKALSPQTDTDVGSGCESTCSSSSSSIGSPPPSSSRSFRSHHLYSPVYPQLLPTSFGRGLPGFGMYQFPSVQLPWLKQSTPVPATGTPMLPVSWPVVQPGNLTPPAAGGPTAAHMHLNKPSSLDMFIRGADGNRWQCQICQRIFTSQGSLRAHARIHTGERPYQCKFCKRTFTQASTLRSHERLHTGERPYKCKHCSKAFTQSAGLRSHLKTHMSR